MNRRNFLGLTCSVVLTLELLTFYVASFANGRGGNHHSRVGYLYSKQPAVFDSAQTYENVRK